MKRELAELVRVMLRAYLSGEVVHQCLIMQVGIREIEEKIWLVSFMHYDLGFFDHETGRVECADNPFQAKVSPMPSE